MLSADYVKGALQERNQLTALMEGPALKADIPGIKTYVRLMPLYYDAVFSYHDGQRNRVFYEGKAYFADSTFLDVFTYPMLQGNITTALAKPMSIVITQSMARKYFDDDTNVLGKMLEISGGSNDGNYVVTGVLKDIPQNSDLQFNCLMSLSSVPQEHSAAVDDNWNWKFYITYVELQPGTTRAAVEARLPAFVYKYKQQRDIQSNAHVVKSLQPVTNIHLNPYLDRELSPFIISTSLYFFIIIAVFILAIAWVNYINLSTARATERAREVGVKKAIGVYRHQLVVQFLAESMLVNFISIILAMVIATWLLPVLGSIVEKELVFDFTDPRLWFILATLFITGTVVSGAYPAFVLSSFKAATILKGTAGKVAGQGFSLRRALVVFQFASSLVLIAGTFAIYRQVQFMRRYNKGMNLQQMLIVAAPLKDLTKNEFRLLSFKDELKKITAVQAVSTSVSIPGVNPRTHMRRLGDAEEENKTGNIINVDKDFIDTYEITLLAGRRWNTDVYSQVREGVMINEAAISALGLGNVENALQERLVLGSDTMNIQGVLKNYHWNSLRHEHIPIVLVPASLSAPYYSIRLSGRILVAVSQVEKLYREYFPDVPFEYYFMDDLFNRQYHADEQFAGTMGLFSLLAIFIACLGLWGLASFTTLQRMKEISIRKVLALL